jgi:hypothetical protein
MVWFLRAIELADGRWMPRFGREDFDIVPDESSALAFLVSLAIARGGVDLYQIHLHRLDGSIEVRAASDALPGETAEG